MSEATLSRISNLIKVEDDLQKIDELRQQFVKEKTSIDLKLHSTTQQQIDSIVTNVESLKMSAYKIAEVKANVDKIKTIHDETVVNTREYETLSSVTTVYQNMMQVQSLYTDIANFRQYVEHIDSMISTELEAVSQNIEYPLFGILRIHYNVTQARNFEEYLNDESRGLSDDTQSIIRKIVAPVSRMVRHFDELLKEIIISITEAVKEGNVAMVHKIVRIIEYEAAEDRKISLVNRLELHNNASRKTADYSVYRSKARHYKKFFYDKVEESLADTFDKCVEHFKSDPMAVYDNLEWLEDELIFVERTLEQLFPEHWGVTEFIFQVYYNRLHDFTMKLIHATPSAEDLMRILAYDNHYSGFIAALRGPQKQRKEGRSILGDELRETVLDDYSKTIITKMTEWNDVLIQQETDTFVNRDQSPDLYSYTQTLDDVDQFDHVVSFDVMTEVYVLPDFKITLSMLKEQADVAADSGYGKVLAAVIENWAIGYNKRVEGYMRLVEEEMYKYMVIFNNEEYLIKESKSKKYLKAQQSKSEPTFDIQSMTEEEITAITKPGLVEYLTALGNTYEINNDKLHDKFLPLYKSKVHANYQERITAAFEQTVGPSADLNSIVIRALVDIIINDLLPALSAVFTSSWYDRERVPNSGEQNMAQRIVGTIEEYMEELKGYATYDMYNITFSVLLDALMTSYLRIGYQNILHGEGKRIDPTITKKHKSFSEALNRDIGIIFEGLDHLFSRKDAMYLVKSLSALEFLIAITTCENVEEEVPQIWEHEILETYYDCSVEYVRGALLCRKDVDSKSVPPIIERLVAIKEEYHSTVPPPHPAVGTLNTFTFT